MEKIWYENNEKISHLVFRCDVLLLADVFKKFRNNSLNNYRLDNYLTAPGLRWDV